MYTQPVSDFDDIHAGQCVFVVGSGPSLLNWNPATFSPFPTIFINRAVHYVDLEPDHKQPRYRVIYDRAALRWHYTNMEAYAKDEPIIPEVHTFMPRFMHQLDDEDREFMKGTTWSIYTVDPIDHFTAPLAGDNLYYPTLFAAMSLALRMGAAHIMLVGVDNGPVAGHSHFDVEKVSVESQDKLFGYLIRRMEACMLPECARRGVAVTRWYAPRKEMGLCETTQEYLDGRK